MGKLESRTLKFGEDEGFEMLRARFVAGGTGDLCEGSSSGGGFYLLVPRERSHALPYHPEIVHLRCAFCS